MKNITGFSLRREEGVQIMLEADRILELDEFILEYKKRLETQIDIFKEKKPKFKLPSNEDVAYKKDYSAICNDERVEKLETYEETGLRCGECELYNYYIHVGKFIYDYLKRVEIVIQGNETTIFLASSGNTAQTPTLKSFIKKYNIDESSYSSGTLVHFLFIFTDLCCETALCNYFISADDASCMLYCTAHFKAAEVVVSFENYIHFLKNIYCVIYPYSRIGRKKLFDKTQKAPKRKSCLEEERK